MKITRGQLRQIIKETISEEVISRGSYRKTRKRGMGHCSDAFKNSTWYDKAAWLENGQPQGHYAPGFRVYFHEESLPRGKKNYRSEVEKAKKTATDKAVEQWTGGDSSKSNKLRAALDVDVAPFKEGVGAICVAVLIQATEYEKITGDKVPHK